MPENTRNVLFRELVSFYDAASHFTEMEGEPWPWLRGVSRYTWAWRIIEHSLSMFPKLNQGHLGWWLQRLSLAVCSLSSRFSKDQAGVKDQAAYSNFAVTFVHECGAGLCVHIQILPSEHLLPGCREHLLCACFLYGHWRNSGEQHRQVDILVRDRK